MINYELLKRFVNDQNIPMQVIKNDKYVNYILDLLQPSFKTRTKWRDLEQLIQNRFDASPDRFLKEFYQVRENIIEAVKSNEKYKIFNESSMDKYKLIDIPEQVSKDNIYKSIHTRKTILSIDLKSANFQALRFAGVLEEDTYLDFIKKFTDLEYIINSKYLRNVVFGQLNPSRHITVEKYITLEIYKYLINEKIIPDTFILLTLVNDELIFEVKGEERPNAQNIIDLIKEKFDIVVKAEYFKLNGLRLISQISSKILDFYEKDKETNEKTLHCIPSQYYAIVYKLYNRNEIEEFDTWFTYDGLVSKFIESFVLERY